MPNKMKHAQCLYRFKLHAVLALRREMGVGPTPEPQDMVNEHPLVSETLFSNGMSLYPPVS